MTRAARCGARRDERGAALILCLILLLVLSVLGASAAGSSALQMRMSRNVEDRNVALQAAEFGLRQAEAQLQAWINAGHAALDYDEACKGQSAAPGVFLFDETAQAQPWELPVAKWDDADSIDAGKPPAADGSPQLAKNPRYMVTIYPTNMAAARPTLEGVEQGAMPGVQGRRYTITAVGWGIRDSTRVKLQVEYYSAF